VTRSHTLKFRPIHHQQLSLKPRYSAQLFQALRSHRKNLRRGPLGAKSGKEEIQDNLIAPSPCSQQFFQLCLSLFDARISKILSVEPQQIKGVEDSSTARKSRGETVLAASGGFIGRVLT
jgi:hypothetical protein